MTSFYMIGSLVLGLSAWILAIISVLRRRFGPLNLISVSACALSLLLQLMNVNYLANGLEDFSAIMDTIHAVVLAAWLMLSIAILLNGTALMRSRKVMRK